MGLGISERSHHIAYESEADYCCCHSYRCVNQGANRTNLVLSPGQDVEGHQDAHRRHMVYAPTSRVELLDLVGFISLPFRRAARHARQ